MVSKQCPTLGMSHCTLASEGCQYKYENSDVIDCKSNRYFIMLTLQLEK
jgi:hypothetical protein